MATLVAMLPSLLFAAPFLLAVGAFLLPDGPPIRHAAAGTVLVSLAAAAAAASTVTAASASFQTINNGLLWCGLVLGLIALASAWRGGQRVASAPLGVALVLALGGCSELLREGHVAISLIAGAVGAVAISALPVAPVRVSSDPATPVVLSAVRRWGMALLLALLLLPSLWFALTVAGPEGMSLQGLREAPFSTAAETLLAALLLPASLILAGVWPFGFIARGPRFAPLGALLLLLVVLPLLDEGMEHWRSVYSGWLVLSALIAAVGATWPQLVAGAGLFAIGCAGGSFWWAGALLTMIASLLSLAPRMHVARRGAMLAAAGCGIVALRATLGVEVVYSTAMALATVIAIVRTPLPAAARN